MSTDYIKDFFFAVIFFLYPFILLVISKGLENIGVRKDTSRKFVHACTGIVILFIPFFTHTWVALIPPIVFTIVNFIDFKFGIFSQIQGEDKGNIGTVLYPISFIILIWVFHGTKWWALAVIGILAMAFGDASASMVGRKFGKTIYHVGNETRSYAGSAAMFLVTFIVCILVFLTYGPTLGLPMRTVSIFATSIILSTIATAVEALSIKGTDNITVPLLTALAGWLIIGVLAPIITGNQAIVNQPLVQ